MSTSSAELALEDVKQYEGEYGRIINDWYSRSEYVKRRHTFLSKHPRFQSMAKLGPLTSRNAELVFPPPEEASTFSVQEVRRRELEHEIDPLLPYPTSDNMETIDGYASYPEDEWQPGDAVDPALSRPGARAVSDSPELVPTVPEDQLLNESNESGPSNVVHSSNDDETAPPPPSSEDAPAEDASINAPVTSGWTPASSIAGRPVHVPVKPQRGTKRKSPDSDEEDVADTATAAASPIQDDIEEIEPEVSDEPEVPRPKRVKFDIEEAKSKTPDSAPTEQTKAPPSRRKASSTSTSASTRKSTKTSSRSKRTARSPSAEEPTKTSSRSKRTASTPSAEEAPKPTSRSKRATSTPSADAQTTTVERIARGEILPKTRILATQAAAHRFSRFRDDHFANSKAHHPDFPPEFFDRANFSRVGDIVRCICGATHDDGAEREWIGCDTEGCEVWQHQECLKDALPEDLDGDYLCHMCDPFTHRRELQKIRRKDGMP